MQFILIETGIYGYQNLESSIHCGSIRSKTTAGSPVVAIRLSLVFILLEQLNTKERQRWMRGESNDGGGRSLEAEALENQRCLLRECQAESRRASSDSAYPRKAWNRPRPCCKEFKSRKLRIQHAELASRRALDEYRGSGENHQPHWCLRAWVIPKRLWLFLFLFSVLMRNVLMFTLSQGR